MFKRISILLTVLTIIFIFDGCNTIKTTAGDVKSQGEVVADPISAHDAVIKQIAREQGLDWRLLSAIAFSESRFNATVISPRGARGLMQIMPSVARQLEFGKQDLMNPTVNVRIAAVLLKRIESMLKFPETIGSDDKLQIVLACYNGGIGHVSDARKLASKYGGNPNSWRDVSKYLSLKKLPEYHDDSVVKNGRFNGGQTLSFVSQVMGKYSVYCTKSRQV